MVIRPGRETTGNEATSRTLGVVPISLRLNDDDGLAGREGLAVLSNELDDRARNLGLCAGEGGRREKRRKGRRHTRVRCGGKGGVEVEARQRECL